MPRQWDNNNNSQAVIRLKQILTQYFQEPDYLEQNPQLINKTLLKKYVWLMREFLFSQENSVYILGLLLDMLTADLYPCPQMTDEDIECLMRYYFAKFLILLHQQDYFSIKGTLMKKYTILDINMEINTIVQGIKTNPVRDLLDNATRMEARLALYHTFPEWNSPIVQPFMNQFPIRNIVVQQLVTRNGLPQEILPLMSRYGITETNHFLTIPINREYIPRFIENLVNTS